MLDKNTRVFIIAVIFFALLGLLFLNWIGLYP